MEGYRKTVLCTLYLIGCFAIAWKAVANGVTGWDAAGVASLFASIATGLGVVVYGNVQEHRARNGHAAGN